MLHVTRYKMPYPLQPHHTFDDYLALRVQDNVVRGRGGRGGGGGQMQGHRAQGAGCRVIEWS